eukprot:1106547-Karenia_brevis.AAC.1
MMPPICVPQGGIVEQNKMPFIRVHGMFPFHVTDPTKLRVYCPEKYRMYAKRDEDNVPIFSEMVTVRNNSQRTKLYPTTT